MCDRSHLVREAEERRKLKKEPPHAEAAQKVMNRDGYTPNKQQRKRNFKFPSYSGRRTTT